ncbi:hypothetical protein [Arthrobacter rhombi]|uniref:hypothetical protein n=1 Tax=Arthrobacter rhombi TaxID=71253 RepID=UPI003FCF3EF1
MTKNNEQPTSPEVEDLEERLAALYSERDRLTERRTALRAEHGEAARLVGLLTAGLAEGGEGATAEAVAAAQPTANALRDALASVDASLSSAERTIDRLEQELRDAQTAAKAAGLLSQSDLDALMEAARAKVDVILFELADTINANARLFNELRIDALEGTGGSDAPVRFYEAPHGEELITPHGTFGNRPVSFVLKDTVKNAADRWAKPARDAQRAEDAAKAAAEAESNARLWQEHREHFAQGQGE